MINKYVEEYIKTWQSIFKLKETISLIGFLLFSAINFGLFLITIRLSPYFNYLVFYPFILFGVSIILSLIKLLNGKERSEGNNLMIDQPVLDFKFFMKLLFASIMIGVINFLLVFIVDSNSINLVYVLFLYCISLIPLSFIVFLTLAIRLNKEMANSILINYFLIFLGISFLGDFLLGMLDK